MNTKLPGSGVLAFLLLCGFAPPSQAATVDDFIGIRWGASAEEAKRIVLTNKQIALEKENNSDLGFLSFQGGSYMGKQATRWFLVFLHDKFCHGFVDFQIDRDRRPLGQIREVKQMLAAKYGKPFLEQDNYPHSDPSWKECLSRKPFFKCDWHLTTSGPKPEATTVRLFLSGNTMQSVGMRLVYGNDALSAEREQVEHGKKPTP